jgi:hypothetical protein
LWPRNNFVKDWNRKNQREQCNSNNRPPRLIRQSLAYLPGDEMGGKQPQTKDSQKH